MVTKVYLKQEGTDIGIVDISENTVEELESHTEFPLIHFVVEAI